MGYNKSMKGIPAILTLVAISIAVIGVFFFFIFIFSQNSEEYIGLNQLETYQKAAESYKQRLLDYQNVCTEIGLSTVNIFCIDNKTGYRLVAPQEDGSFLCADNTGFLGRITLVSNGTFACQR